MRRVSDDFLLNMAEVSATLVGLFLVAVFFYVETGFRRFEGVRGPVERYFRAGTRIVLILYAIPLLVSLTLVTMEPVWGRMLFVVLSVTLVATNVETVMRIRPVARVFGSPALFFNEVAGSIAVVAIVILPWALGGLRPTREDLAWSIILSFATGLMSVAALVMSVFDRPRASGDADPEVIRHDADEILEEE